MTVLVGYSSRHGSTAEIATRIAETIRATGAQVEVHPVEAIGDPSQFDAVVFGSGVYDGSWNEDAVRFVREHAASLCQKPVWFFSVGSFGDTHPVIGGLMKKEPREMPELKAAVHPRDYRVFAGVLNLECWPSWGALMFKALGGRQGDNRDWPDIEAWAATIRQTITREREVTRAAVR
jgi:menaquinone-dependent protoporphyrinogen oxidase